MNRLPEAAAAAALSATAAAFGVVVASLPLPVAADWTHCWHEDHCQAHHLNVALAQGTLRDGDRPGHAEAPRLKDED